MQQPVPRHTNFASFPIPSVALTQIRHVLLNQLRQAGQASICMGGSSWEQGGSHKYQSRCGFLPFHSHLSTLMVDAHAEHPTPQAHKPTPAPASTSMLKYSRSSSAFCLTSSASRAATSALVPFSAESCGGQDVAGHRHIQAGKLPRNSQWPTWGWLPTHLEIWAESVVTHRPTAHTNCHAPSHHTPTHTCQRPRASCASSAASAKLSTGSGGWRRMRRKVPKRRSACSSRWRLDDIRLRFSAGWQ